MLENLCKDEGFSPLSYEIILVDDGSTDNSWQLIKAFHDNDPRVKGISFSRNFGHHIAITAGLDKSRGEAVILLDGDLQDPPEEIPKLYKEFKKGKDLVYGIRQSRQDSAIKKINVLALLVDTEEIFRSRHPGGTDNAENHEQKAG